MRPLLDETPLDTTTGQAVPTQPPSTPQSRGQQAEGQRIPLPWPVPPVLQRNSRPLPSTKESSLAAESVSGETEAGLARPYTAGGCPHVAALAHSTHSWSLAWAKATSCKPC